MNNVSRWAAMLALLFATAAWGGLFHAGKLVLNNVDPFWFTVVRYTGAALLLCCILLLQGNVRWTLLREHWLRLASLGLMGYGMFGILVFIGLSHSVPSHGAVIMATMPITTLLMRWVFERQRPQLWAWCVVALAIFGVSLVSGVWHGNTAEGQSTVVGDLIAFVGTVGWIMYTRGQASVSRLSVIEYTTFTAILALPGLFAFALVATFLGYAHRPAPADLIAAIPPILYIVVIGTVLAALAFNKGVRTLGAVHGIVFINLVPVSALLISVAKGALPNGSEVVGTLLIIVALTVQARKMGLAVKASQ
ncbi:DMT family transporter [Jeongeupia naejangsanensis]|uniref:DMT family transporter n=1 Tax=Jeongeupia naejangsanensis TaxID=613195 RepID=A0ABS2BLG6_9NEIS|nr:DMT family transporter [Jeongeupia naejangsanensis]MBM3115836.1 DMT family transporter [Jeongeupia naejangsanensis]